LRVSVERRPGPLTVVLSGVGATDLPADATNLVVRTITSGQGGEGLAIAIDNELPLSAGCGSSAAAIVAGLAARDALAGHEPDLAAICREAVGIEGHPDNVAAAVFGGFTIAASDGPIVRRIEPPAGLAFVLAIPTERLSTADARAALSTSASRADAVHNVQRVALLVSALHTGRLEDLVPALSDRLHQDARSHLVPTFARLASCAERIGALGVTLSGAGPSVLIWCRAERLGAVAGCVRAEAPAADVRAIAPEPVGLVFGPALGAG
jgi:homoserine kinase